jgi:hypothetical protein
MARNPKALRRRRVKGMPQVLIKLRREPLSAPERTNDSARLEATLTSCGLALVPSASVAPSHDLVVYPFVCPACEGGGRWSEGETCWNCAGRGLVRTMDGWDEEPVAAPRPPAVMKGPCGDCAFLAGSPEQDAPPPLDKPFFCHAGMPEAEGYAPTAWYGGLPLGYLVCGGWWAKVNGEALPERECKMRDKDTKRDET